MYLVFGFASESKPQNDNSLIDIYACFCNAILWSDYVLSSEDTVIEQGKSTFNIDFWQPVKKLKRIYNIGLNADNASLVDFFSIFGRNFVASGKFNLDAGISNNDGIYNGKILADFSSGELYGEDYDEGNLAIELNGDNPSQLNFTMSSKVGNAKVFGILK